MLTVDEALGKILATTVPLEVTEISLSKSLGMTLAVDIHSPTDSPPFDKSLMDGYAVRFDDVVTGSPTLRVIETITAGHVSQKAVGPGEASQIMTGAPIPAGANAVIKVEETERDGHNVVIRSSLPVENENIIRRGTSVRAGACVLRAGQTLNGSRIGALAELGCAVVPVRRRPRVAILATGDELVPVETTPGPGQIRNSNESMLVAQIEAAGGIALPLGIAQDDRDALRHKIDLGLQSDILVLAGGVSAGTLDLVPDTLAEAGVAEVFHKVQLKPGKPIWYGLKSINERNLTRTCYVFGLPGNPVSSLVCCELFVRTAIRRLMGVEPAVPQPILGKLEHAYSTRADRPTYHPARLTWTSDGLAVTLVSWHGSSDLCGTVAANGMAYLTGEARQLRAGDSLHTFAW